MGAKSCLSTLFLLVSIVVYAAHITVSFDKALYYKAFGSKDITVIDTELKRIISSSFPEKDAFEGALLMKKASIVPGPKSKLSLFKEGRIKLENAINQSESNAEYRFLRLMIQENAPRVLNYNDNIVIDSKLIKTSYRNMPAPVLQAVKEYSKTSDYIKPTDFQ